MVPPISYFGLEKADNAGKLTKMQKNFGKQCDILVNYIWIDQSELQPLSLACTSCFFADLFWHGV